MTNKAEDEGEESIKIGPGDFLAFGSINLLFTLYLTKDDLNKYKIEWENLKTLKNIKFIRKHKHFWKKIELSSTDDTMNILLHINKTSKKLIKIGYVGLKKMIFQDDQIDFQDFIIRVLNKRGIYLTSCDVCKCIINIQLLLKYEKEEKYFLLCGVPLEMNDSKNKEYLGKDKTQQKDNNNREKEEKNNEKKEKGKKEEEKNKEKIINVDKKKEYEDDKKIEKEKKEEKDTEENKEEDISKLDGDNEVNNPFVNIVDSNINARDFHFIYFDYNNYINGEFKGKIRLEHLFEYFQDIKIRTKSKIILNFEDEVAVFKNINKDEIFKDLLSITDVFIFYNKNKLYEILKDLKTEEDQEVIDLSHRIHYFESQRKLIEKENMKKKEEEWIIHYKNLLEQFRGEREKKIPKHLRTEGNINGRNIYITQDKLNDKNSDKLNHTINNNNETESKNESTSPNAYQMKTEPQNEFNYRELNNERKIKTRINNLQPIKPSPPLPLSKNDMFNYFKNGILSRDPQKNPTGKIILVLDEFNKIFIVKCKKFEEKPLVLDFDLKLYPQVNMRNMNDILNFKKFIKSKYPEYINIFIASFLGVIAGKGKSGCEDDSLFMGYLVATNIIKKIAEIQKNNLPLPKNKEFFYPSINKKELEKILIEANKRKKESSFILDGNNKKEMIIKPYNPLLDKNLYTYLNSKNNRNFLKNNGFIGKNGKIIYDPVYRETLGFNKGPKNYHSIQNMKIPPYINEKTNKSEEKSTNKFLVGYRIKSPGYEVYKERQKKQIILPPLFNKKQPISIKNNKKDIIEEKSDEDKSNSESRNDNETFSGSGEGSGSGDE